MVTFDGDNKLMICDFGTTTLDVKRLYSMWKEWCTLTDNLKYDKAFAVIGGESTTGVNIITPYFFLTNGWRIRPYEANHTLEVSGILISQDGDEPFVDTLGIWRINIKAIVPIYTETVTVPDTSGFIDAVEVLNRNIKKASLLIPATEDI